MFANFNWKTTLFGFLAAVIPYVRGIIPVELTAVADAASALALALMGYFAADKK